MSKDKKKPDHHSMTESRLAHIGELMESLEWRRGKTGPELARLWGLSLKRIEELTAEASKRVKEKLFDKDRVGSKVAAVLDRVMDDAMAQNDRRSAIEAAKTYAMIAGATAAQKLEVTGANAGPMRIELEWPDADMSTNADDSDSDR